MQITKKDYDELAKRKSPPTRMYLTIPKAFLTGGAICCAGQAFMDLYSSLGVAKSEVPLLVSITLVFISAVLTGLGVYGKIAKFGGAGALVPITGFANAVVSPALEFRSEGLVLGTAAKMFIIAGPVIVYGVAASFVYGIIFYFMH